MKAIFEILHLVREGSTNHRHVGNTSLTTQRYNSDAKSSIYVPVTSRIAAPSALVQRAPSSTRSSHRKMKLFVALQTPSNKMANIP